MHEVDVRVFQIVVHLGRMRILENLFVLLAQVKSLLDTALINGVNRVLLIPVVIACIKFGSRCIYSRMPLVVDDGCRVLAIVTVNSSDEAALLLDELIIVLLFICCRDSAKSTHSQVERIHGTRHCVDECWLVLINKAVHPVRRLLDFLTLLLEHGVGLRTLTFHWRLADLVTALSVKLFARALTAHLDALLVHEVLHASAILHTLRQGTLVVGLALVDEFSVALCRRVAKLGILRRN